MFWPFWLSSTFNVYIDVCWGSLGTSIFGNSSLDASNTRSRLPSRLSFRFLWPCSRLSYSCIVCIVWAQNINTVRRLTILQKKALRIMNFKAQFIHSIPLFSSNNILKYGDRIKLENILFVNKSINRQVPSTFNDWFTFSWNLHRYKICWSATNHLNIPTFWTQKHGHFGIRASVIRSWNYTQDMLKINLSLKNSTPNSVKYFLTNIL